MHRLSIPTLFYSDFYLWYCSYILVNHSRHYSSQRQQHGWSTRISLLQLKLTLTLWMKITSWVLSVHLSRATEKVLIPSLPNFLIASFMLPVVPSLCLVIVQWKRDTYIVTFHSFNRVQSIHHCNGTFSNKWSNVFRSLFTYTKVCPYNVVGSVQNPQLISHCFLHVFNLVLF